LAQDFLVLDEPLPSTSHWTDRAGTFKSANLTEPERAKIDGAVDASSDWLPSGRTGTGDLIGQAPARYRGPLERKRQIIEQTPGCRCGEAVRLEDIGGVENVKGFLRAVLEASILAVIVFIDEIEKAFAGTARTSPV